MANLITTLHKEDGVVVLFFYLHKSSRTVTGRQGMSDPYKGILFIGSLFSQRRKGDVDSITCP